MKKLLLSILFAISVNSVFAQAIETKNPYVENPEPSSIYGTTKIEAVVLVENYTFVVMSYRTGRYDGGWLALSNNTYLYTQGKQFSSRIIGWKVVDNITWESFSDKELNFDERYSVNPNELYTFLLTFDRVPAGIETISIEERVPSGDGFYWRGIHINNPISSSPSPAQSGQEDILTAYVTAAKHNGDDVSEWALNSRIKTVFYTVDGELYMANYAEAADTQSWGRVTNLQSQHFDESAENYEMDQFTFTWYYQNSYDSKSGTCQIVFTKIFKPQGITTHLKMVTESLDVTEYTGYMEGSLNLDRF